MTQHRIGLDIRMLRNTGIGTYLRGLLCGFEELGLGEGFDLSLFGADPFAQWPIQTFDDPIYSIAEQRNYPQLLSQCRLWHAPHYNVPLIKGKTKLVVTIHDIIHWIFRKQFLTPIQSMYAGLMLKRAVDAADHIIAVSNHTKKDLVENFRAKEAKITVIYEGVAEEFHRLSSRELQEAARRIRSVYAVPERFFVYVGMMKPHKNVHRLIRVFRRLKAQQKIDASLVLIGRKDKKYPHGFEDIEDLVSDKDIIHLPSVEYEDLVYFYNTAIALIHPSLYEGFGLTLLEAMRCGAPVITTNAASIPEVVGNAAICVDPTSEEAMADAITTMDSDIGLQESLRQKGLERSQQFSWTDMARKTAMVYEKVLGSL